MLRTLTMSSEATRDPAAERAEGDEGRLWGPEDSALFKDGRHVRIYHGLGAHPGRRRGVCGTHFALWAPNAERVSVIGDFNGWDPDRSALTVCADGSGIWEGFVPGAGRGQRYKYVIVSRFHGYRTERKDPVGFFSETPPATASVIWDFDYTWGDEAWMRGRARRNAHDRPISIYEVHLGSWRRIVEENDRFLTYREAADYLVDYVHRMGFTHVEFLPVMGHPFYESWGYQTLDYFGPCPWYGTPEDLMALIDAFHRAEIGVILDWVPSHAPCDGHGLAFFDGTHLYEHQDPRKGFHPDWRCLIFNNGRNEVKEFLISSALFWLDRYHADGLRVDAVASMLYLDYSRKPGEWVPNAHGGRENLDSIRFLKELNETVYAEYPGVQMFAEESTAWGGVSRPTYAGGLGFGFKWNMGWMNDTLRYFAHDPVHRKHHHDELTFSMLYAFSENFVLSLSHDEVVHGKGSLLTKMPGDDWRKFANLRLLYGYMYAHPGKKLLFMGGEFAQRAEWNVRQSLDWHLVQFPAHQGVQRLVRDLNILYRKIPCLHERDCEGAGFEWIAWDDWEQSVICFLRKDRHGLPGLLVVCHFTPVVRHGYRVGVPLEGPWEEILNTDRPCYGGSGQGNPERLVAESVGFHGRPASLVLTLPPLAAVYLRPRPDDKGGGAIITGGAV